MSAADPTDPIDAPAPPPAPGPQAAPAKKGFARRHWGKLSLVTLIGVPLLGMSIWAGVALSYSYSQGTRTGYLQKISRKGWFCKTWEGELAMATAPGVSPQIFAFSVRNDSIARALESEMGKGRIALKYDEHRGVPTSCFGETPYFVIAYEVIPDVSRPPLP